jgi:ribonuclease P protein component
VKRRFRLSKSTDFQRVQRFGKSYSHPLLVLIVLPGQGDTSRFGVAAGRMVGKAVRRNRAKRLIRNAVNSFIPVIKPGWDVIIIARKLMIEATFEQTQSALQSLLYRARLLDESSDVRVNQ